MQAPSISLNAIDNSERIRRNTPAFHRTNLALFFAGWATFALLYGVQPLMPLFSLIFKVTPTASSLIVSLTTGTMAVNLLVMGTLSEVVGRKPLMSASLTCSAFLTACLALSPNFTTLLALRTLTGFAISGLPAVAMAYIGEEVEPSSLGLAMGLFIAGSGLGGMSGRLIVAAITDYVSWRAAVATIGVLGLGSALLFWRSLPPSRHFVPKSLRFANQVTAFHSHFFDDGLPWLFALAFLLMGSFVTLYNYLGFRLLGSPFYLSQSAIGLLFAVYLAGTVSSALAGSLADRFGRRKVLWLFVLLFFAGAAVTLSARLWVIVTALGLATFGFFGAHSIASSWVGRRATQNRAQASALYLFCYYLGSSVLGSLGGLAWSNGAWTGVVIMVASLLLFALLIAIRLSLLQPLALGTRALEPSAIKP